MPWYRAGVVNVTNGSVNIIGIGTTWSNGAVPAGAAFSLIDTSGAAIAPFYEVLSVTDDTHITLKTPYGGMTVTGAQYALWNLAGEQTTPYLAAAVSELVRKCKNVETDSANAQTAADRAQAIATQFGDVSSAISEAHLAAEGAASSESAAATSETAAQNAQTAAETAQSAAQTAKTVSEAARDVAVSSKNDAVTARIGAQTAQSGAQTAEGNAVTARAAAENARDESMRYASLSLSNATAGENDQTFAEALLQQNLNTNYLFDKLEEGGII